MLEYKLPDNQSIRIIVPGGVIEIHSGLTDQHDNPVVRVDVESDTPRFGPTDGRDYRPFNGGKGVVQLVGWPAITPDMAGCWLDGSMGWHNSYRVVDRATEYGFTVPTEYAYALADYRANGHECSEDNWETVCGQGGLTDMATDFLQERAPDGYVFEWGMGEFSLIPESESESFGL